MPFVHHVCQLLHDSAVATDIRESSYLFPAIETIHVLGITVLVGSVAIVDLRLLGVVLTREKVSEIAGQLLPVTWVGFAIMVTSGFLIFSSEATDAYRNPAFRIKLVLLLLAGLNPLIFHSTIYRKIALWDESPYAPPQARLTAALSLILWSCIIVAGRAIAYFH